jgi:XTP/dITP diphosphohydrolase
VKLLLATRNAKKLDELRRILSPLLAVEVLGLDDVAPYDEVPETGATFTDNALLKARSAVLHTGMVSVADDSGIAIDALNGMPGVLSARWAGARKSDAANLQLVLEQLADTPDERRGAAFVCVAALVTPSGVGMSSGVETVVEGQMPGRVVREPRGSNGFGYDPIFVADGKDVTNGELPPAEKDAISHRGKALRGLAPHIAAAFG